MNFVPMDVGSWIQGAGDGKEARWTEQLVNLLRQIAVAVAKGYDGLQVDQGDAAEGTPTQRLANDGTGNFSRSSRNTVD